jgi:hypothetical protein
MLHYDGGDANQSGLKARVLSAWPRLWIPHRPGVLILSHRAAKGSLQGCWINKWGYQTGWP